MALVVQFSTRRTPMNEKIRTKTACASIQPPASSSSSLIWLGSRLIAPSVGPGEGNDSLGGFGCLLRHQQSSFLANTEVLTVPVRRVQRLVNQAHVPVPAVGDVDHVTPLALQMREAHQKVQLSR